MSSGTRSMTVGFQMMRMRPPAMTSKLFVWHHSGNVRLIILAIADVVIFVSKMPKRQSQLFLMRWATPLCLRGRLKPLTFQKSILMVIEGESPLQAAISVHGRMEHMAEWSSSKGLDTSKVYEYFRPKRAKQPWQTVIWKAFIPPKYSFILWLGLRGRLSTRDRLMFLQEDSSCSLCINIQETAKHLFFECPFSNLVWTNIRQWLGIHRRMSTLLSAVKWLIKEKRGPPCRTKRDSLLWHARSTAYGDIATKLFLKAKCLVLRDL
ncbi:UNVERIFIED_CONTAM: hypothetical protein Scaly_3120600 [Sesamum calycinum]|uniref:Reverse transcriptase zinc-binding domain-containing protein n=1 Tax=Sesamum calycinum TaxID=2727403 RepID=A0AAW2JJG8_9LAMI